MVSHISHLKEMLTLPCKNKERRKLREQIGRTLKRTQFWGSWAARKRPRDEKSKTPLELTEYFLIYLSIVCYHFYQSRSIEQQKYFSCFRTLNVECSFFDAYYIWSQLIWNLISILELEEQSYRKVIYHLLGLPLWVWTPVGQRFILYSEICHEIPISRSVGSPFLACIPNCLYFLIWPSSSTLTPFFWSKNTYFYRLLSACVDWLLVGI